MNGLATSKAMLFDTDYATISGAGNVNLASEAIKLDIDPRSKSATVSAAVPVEIRGTLATPHYGVNKLAAARKIGGILAGIAFPPALIAGLAEPGTGEPTPCAGGANKAVQKTASAPAPGKDPVGGALKGLFGK